MKRISGIALAAALAGCSQPPAPAPGASPRAVVEAVFAAFNRHDPAAMAALYAPDAVLTSSERCHPLEGAVALQRIHTELFAAAPDIRDEVKDIVAEGDLVAVQFVSRSQTPGMEFELTIADFFEVRNGLIIRDNTIFDNGGAPCRD
jgi:ketosteroid isomerase-like protein